MADNKDKKVLNVPVLRFPEFTEEWKNTTLKNECSINPTSDKLKDEFVYVDLESVEKGELTKKQVIEKENAPSRAQRVLRNGDVLFQCVRPYQRNNYLVKNVSSEVQWVASTGYAQLRTERNNPAFIYHLLNTSSFNKKVIVRCTGSSYPAINSDDLSKIHFYICGDIEEQKRIADFLTLLDERIATQNKIIEKLETLIKGIRNNIISKIKGDCIVLQDIADIYQPQTIASTDLTEDGYLVYGANGIIGKYHSFNHEKEQICITCRGNTCGTVNFTEPKSWITGNAMVINTDNYAKNVNKRYLFHYLSSINFNSIISGSGQPQIVRQPLAKLKLILPVLIIQNRIAECLDAMFAKMKNEQSFLQILQIQKSCLLSQMFI